jgi:predicted enzyme related to lactoylglutathione lyase
MTSGMSTIIYPVKDLARATAYYSALLGVTPYVDQSYYVGFRVGGQELGLDPHGLDEGMTGPVGYWDVTDIQDSLRQLQEAGAQVKRPVTDVGGGKLIATVADADGNLTGLSQAP